MSFRLIPKPRPSPLGVPPPLSPYGIAAAAQSPARSPGLGEHLGINSSDTIHRAERDRLRPLTPVTPLSAKETASRGFIAPPRGTATDGLDTLFNSWLFEFIWILVSVASFAVIVAVLLVYDDQSLPQLPLSITLNTFVAFFSTISKAAFMLPIAEAISQCKWNWFRHNRPLSDFETFDEASRGFWGSVTLLFRVRWQNVASLGAVVTILSVMSSPITQQVISYPTRMHQTGQVGDVSTSAVQFWGYDPEKSKRGPPNMINSAVHTGFMTLIGDPISQIPIPCPSGSCDFPEFNSLAMCYKVANITHKLSVEEQSEVDLDSWPLQMLMTNVTRQYQVGLGDDCNMTSPSTMAFRTCASHPNVSYAFQDDPDLVAAKIYSLPIIYSMFDAGTFENKSDPAPVRWGAMEALFHLCVRSYSVSVVNGNATTKSVRESWTGPANNTNKPLTIECNELSSLEPIQCIVPGEDLGPQGGWITLQNPAKPESMNYDDYFGAQKSTLDMLIDSIHLVTESVYMYDPTDNSDNAWAIGSGHVQMIEAFYNNDDEPFNTTLPLSDKEQVDRMEVIFSNFATTVTNLMRTAPPWTASSTTNPLNSFPVPGSILAEESFVHVRWGWITYMAGEILLATAFLVLTVLYTRWLRTRVLKSSQLATLLALSDETRASAAAGGVGGVNSSPRRVRSNARALTVNLVGNEIAVSEARGEGGSPGGVGRGRAFALWRADSKGS